MTEALPTLAGDDIQINEAGLEAIATFVFPDGMRFSAYIPSHTLNNWVEPANARDIRAAVLKRSAALRCHAVFVNLILLHLSDSVVCDLV
jgi:hypothetical protein